ncbi:hypothetical protein BS50DRAFT_578496 [Corynespora cassiicola Philippines]|uniref:Uncharacterized protein n=1 Tax=Corynespora cassiicola Philippines TaxID=1448308 RepID=A0A2T2N8Z4_CORCC|nr:hypothetical protein BS50DRAFT_578496 [Corynespora cassiicola Philippines]
MAPKHKRKATEDVSTGSKKRARKTPSTLNPNQDVTATTEPRPAAKVPLEQKISAAAQTSRLLRLPGELRNMIYKLALTAPHGLRCRWHKGFNRRKRRPVLLVNSRNNQVLHEANQLKYVSHFLYKETAGLESKYNDVIFDSVSKEFSGAKSGFDMFVNSCTPSKLSWLKMATIGEKTEGITADFMEWFEPEAMPHIMRLFEFCASHPEITVRYRVRGWSCKRSEPSTLLGVVFRAAALLKAFRDVEIYDAIPVREYRQAGYQDDAVLMLGRYAEEVKQYRHVTNLRFMPRDARFDLTGYWRNLRDVTRYRFPEEEAAWRNVGHQFWMRPIKDWHDNGI